MAARILVCVALLSSQAFGITFEFVDPANGNYQYIQITGIDPGDGYLYTATPKTMTYEELQSVNVFDYPAHAVRWEIRTGLEALQIPSGDVRQDPQKAYWVDTPWPSRLGTFQEYSMTNCSTPGQCGDYLERRGWESDVLGSSMDHDSWLIPYPFMQVTRAAVPEPSSFTLLLLGLLASSRFRRRGTRS